MLPETNPREINRLLKVEWKPPRCLSAVSVDLGLSECRHDASTLPTSWSEQESLPLLSSETDTYRVPTHDHSPMYVGRFLVVGSDRGGYRVSSRSFPNRQAVARDNAITIGPTDDAPTTDNPYISYNCLRETDRGVVIGNGSHVDAIAEKLGLGTPARDAISDPLSVLDFEKDDYDTPRIAGIVGIDSDDPTAGGPGAIVGIVRRDALIVEAVSEPTLVATYERNRPTPFDLDATTASGAARELYDHEFEHPVCAVGVTVEAGQFDIATVNE